MDLIKLRKKQILELCSSLLYDYIVYLTKDEINYINNVVSIKVIVIVNITNIITL